MEELGFTSKGYTIYRQKNTLIGGYDYFSDSISCGYKVIGAEVTIDELEFILEHMKAQEANDNS